MPILIGAAALAIMFGFVLLLFTTYWVLLHFRQFAQGLPVVGNAVASLGQYLLDRNAEIIRDLFNFITGTVNWASAMLYQGVTGTIQFFEGVWHDLISSTVARLNGLDAWRSLTSSVIDIFIVPQIQFLRDWQHGIDNLFSATILPAINALQAWKTAFVDLNINSLNFWRQLISDQMANTVIPSINQLTHTLSIVTGLTLPQIQDRQRQTEATIGQTITAPHTGLLDRTQQLENGLAQVLPWAAAIGISIPVAANLARLGRNPCWCQQEGPLQDNGTLELAVLMDLL